MKWQAKLFLGHIFNPGYGFGLQWAGCKLIALSESESICHNALSLAKTMDSPILILPVHFFTIQKSLMIQTHKNFFSDMM